MESLETRLAATQDGLESTRAQVENFSLAKTGKVAGKENVKGVSPHSSDSIGAPVDTSPSASDPEAGFVQDYAVKAFRQAMILFKGQKYPEAILAFTAFMEGYADHPLAGTAQFHIGESYYLQKEPKLAKAEYAPVLTDYDLSPYVPVARRRLSETEPTQKKYQQLLLSLYPTSPAAQFAKLSPEVEPAGPAVKVTRPVVDAPPETVPAMQISNPAIDTVPAEEHH